MKYIKVFEDFEEDSLEDLVSDKVKINFKVISISIKIN